MKNEELSIFTKLGFVLSMKEYSPWDKSWDYLFAKNGKTALVTLGDDYLSVLLNGRDIPLASKLSMHFGIPTFETIGRGECSLEWDKTPFREIPKVREFFIEREWKLAKIEGRDADLLTFKKGKHYALARLNIHDKEISSSTEIKDIDLLFGKPTYKSVEENEGKFSYRYLWHTRN